MDCVVNHTVCYRMSQAGKQTVRHTVSHKLTNTRSSTHPPSPSVNHTLRPTVDPKFAFQAQPTNEVRTHGKPHGHAHTLHHTSILTFIHTANPLCRAHSRTVIKPTKRFITGYALGRILGYFIDQILGHIPSPHPGMLLGTH